MYRCKNCSNVAIALLVGTQQNNPVELLEVEQQEQLQDDTLRREYGEEWVGEEKDEEDPYPSED